MTNYPKRLRPVGTNKPPVNLRNNIVVVSVIYQPVRHGKGQETGRSNLQSATESSCLILADIKREFIRVKTNLMVISLVQAGAVEEFDKLKQVSSAVRHQAQPSPIILSHARRVQQGRKMGQHDSDHFIILGLLQPVRGNIGPAGITDRNK